MILSNKSNICAELYIEHKNKGVYIMNTIQIDKVKLFVVKLFVIIAAIFIFTFLIKSIKNNVLVASAQSQRELYYTSVSIEEDDTLWSIATEYYSDEYKSVSEYVNEIKELNDLGSDKITSGFNILVPYYR